MGEFSTALLAALDGDNPLIFTAIQIDLPGGTIRLIEGSGEVTFNGATFKGQDATYGAIGSIDVIDDGMLSDAPSLVLTLAPPSNTAAATLSGATMQGSRVRLWLGAVTKATGAVIDTAPLFDGILDQPVLVQGKGTRSVEYHCVGHMEKLFWNDDAVRLTHSFHRRMFPTEEGLKHVTGVTRFIYWGVDKPYTSGAGGGSGGWGPGGGNSHVAYR